MKLKSIEKDNVKGASFRDNSTEDSKRRKVIEKGTVAKIYME